MEAFDGPYSTYNGHQLRVASGWTKFVIGATPPRFMIDGDYAALFAGAGAIPRHIEGNLSQNFWLGHPFVGGLYQQIAVTPGKAYAAKAFIFTVVGSTVPDPDGKMVKQVGIDPYGGTNPSADWIQWGEPDGRDKTYKDIDIRAAAWAKSDRITLFLKVTNLAEVKPDWNAVWLDTAVVQEAATARASSPASSPPGSFTVEWAGQNPPNGSILYYDVESKDGAGGAWTSWLSKTDQGRAPWDGQPGHTYCFRARAWASYDGIKLHGPFSASGDTCTSVGG